ncbi:MAG: general secretion pathway protein GspB, partial [Gammaproteobacteria bacterium]
ADEARPVTEPSTLAGTVPAQTPTTRQAMQQPVAQIPAKPSPAATQAAGVSAAELPSVQELYLSGELSGPQLNLDLHVYFPQSSRRVVFISGKRYREGDSLDVGMTVKEIIPAGVILSRRGRDYLLQAN